MPKPALSRERIVDAAIALLDADGEDGLTFRALAARLRTGAGAIYWHIANRSELLAAASDAIVARVLTRVAARVAPKPAIRRIAVGVFEAVDAHPWVGAQLAQWRAATLQIFEHVGQRVQALGVARGAHFTAAFALVSYIIGASIQNAAQGRAAVAVIASGHDRASFLAAEAARWQALDPASHPFTRSVATQLRKHDDRAEFLAGVELILGGAT